MAQTSFSFEYVLSVGLALGSALLINRNSPGVSPLLGFVLIPIVVAYTSLFVMNSFFPKLNSLGQQYGGLFEDKALSTLDSMNYIQMLPPFLFVMVLFFILLFMGKLG
jgi:hypothetical protein